MKKISIIIPVYNTDKYLDKCLDSILNQTYENLEIICINDGSTDNSKNILDFYEKKDGRIIVVHKDNEGVSAARNVGLKIATGDYIGFVDSDDYIEKDMYQVLADTLTTSGADIASCGYNINNGEETIPAINKGSMPTKVLKTEDFLYYIYKRDEYKGVAGYLWTRLFKREIIKSYENIFVSFRPEYGGADDLVFIAETAIRCEKMIYVNVPMYNYLHRNNSITRDKIKNIETLEWPIAYEEVIRIYEEAGIPKEIIDIICRMYVYRCGMILEDAINFNMENKVIQLKKMINKYVDVYIATNSMYPDRIEWITNLVR